MIKEAQWPKPGVFRGRYRDNFIFILIRFGLSVGKPTVVRARLGGGGVGDKRQLCN